MKSRVLVSVIGVPVLLYVVLWAPEAVMIIGLALLCCIGAFELMRCIGASAGYMIVTSLVSAGVLWCAADAQWAVAWCVCGYVLLSFLWAILSHRSFRFEHLMGGFFAVVALPYAFSAFLRMWAAGFHRGFLLLPFLFSFMSDTCAFFAGHAFGRHKLAPRVSPKKTVEGAIGGLVGNAVGGLIFAFVMNTWFGEAIPYGEIALLGVMCSVIAQIGDLSFSYIKREFEIKDYGHIFLEHGGVLDRFDSVIFVAPTLSLLLIQLYA